MRGRLSDYAWLSILSAAIFTAGAWWGLPAVPHTWAADEFSPYTVVVGLSEKFSGGWYELYPPFHIYVLTLAELPVLIAGALVGLPSTDPTLSTIAYVISRVVSVIAGIAVVLLVYNLARRLFSRGSALLAAVAAASIPPVVYYAKIANVDMPYAAWFLLSMWCFYRALDGHERRFYFGLTLSAACAIGTKDQAYGLYPLLPIPLLFSYLGARVKEPGTGVARRLLRWPMLPAALAGVVALACIHNLAFNWQGAFDRIQTMTGSMTTSLRRYPPTLQGHLGMLLLGVRHLRWAFGTPGLVLCIVGTVVAAWRWRQAPRAAFLFLPVLSYWVFLIAPLGYHYDRYLLPVMLLLAIFVGHGAWLCWSFLRSHAGPRVAWAAVGVLVAYQLAMAVSVNWLLITDTRYRARAWLYQRTLPSTKVLAVGWPEYLPLLFDFNVEFLKRPTLDYFADNEPMAVVLSGAFGADRFAKDPEALRFLDALERGRLPYSLRFLASPKAFPLLEMRGIESNFDKISPEIRIYFRK